MKKRDARIYIVEPVEVYNQREGRRLRGRTRQTMTDASRKKATVLISRRKRSPVFHLCAVGSGYAFAITPSGSTCGLCMGSVAGRGFFAFEAAESPS